MKKGAGNTKSRNTKNRIVPTNYEEDFETASRLPVVQYLENRTKKRRNLEKILKLKREKCKWLGSIKEIFTPVPFDELKPGKIYIYKLNHITRAVGYWIGRFLNVDYDENTRKRYLSFETFWWRKPRNHVDAPWETPQFFVKTQGEHIELIEDRKDPFSIYKCVFFDIESNDYMNIFAENLPTKPPEEICKMMVDLIDEKAHSVLEKSVKDWLYRPPDPEHTVKPGPMYTKLEKHFYSLMPPPVPYSRSISKIGGKKSRKTKKNRKRVHTKN
jgi:hypothetical protein